MSSGRPRVFSSLLSSSLKAAARASFIHTRQHRRRALSWGQGGRPRLPCGRGGRLPRNVRRALHAFTLTLTLTSNSSLTHASELRTLFIRNPNLPQSMTSARRLEGREPCTLLKNFVARQGIILIAGLVFLAWTASRLVDGA